MKKEIISVKGWLNELRRTGIIHQWEQVSDTKYQIDFDFDIVSPVTPQEKTDWEEEFEKKLYPTAIFNGDDMVQMAIMQEKCDAYFILIRDFIRQLLAQEEALWMEEINLQIKDRDKYWLKKIEGVFPEEKLKEGVGITYWRDTLRELKKRLLK